MHEVKETLSQCLMKAWKKGWPEYCEDVADDYTSVAKLSEKVCNQLNIKLDSEEGIKRVCIAITRISKFCSSNVPWCFKNVFWANLCFQNLYNHMKSIERLKKIRSQGYDYKK